MERTWKNIRNDALSLGPSHQALLVEEMVERLAKNPHMKAWLDESEDRLEAYRRGEIKAIGLNESLRRVRF